MKSPRTGGDRGEGGDFQSGKICQPSTPGAPKSQHLKGVVSGFHDALGELYAAYDDAAAHVDPGVRTSRFAAWLAPFPNERLAELALIAAGAVIGGVA